jgi:hypothetical protein
VLITISIYPPVPPCKGSTPVTGGASRFDHMDDDIAIDLHKNRRRYVTTQDALDQHATCVTSPRFNAGRYRFCVEVSKAAELPLARAFVRCKGAAETEFLRARWQFLKRWLTLAVRSAVAFFDLPGQSGKRQQHATPSGLLGVVTPDTVLTSLFPKPRDQGSTSLNRRRNYKLAKPQLKKAPNLRLRAPLWFRAIRPFTVSVQDEVKCT